MSPTTQLAFARGPCILTTSLSCCPMVRNVGDFVRLVDDFPPVGGERVGPLGCHAMPPPRVLQFWQDSHSKAFEGAPRRVGPLLAGHTVKLLLRCDRRVDFTINCGRPR